MRTLFLGLTLFCLCCACKRAPSPPVRVAAWPVVQGSVQGGTITWHVALTDGEGLLLCPLEHRDDEWGGCQQLDALSLAELRAMDAGTWSPRSTFFLTEVQEATMPAELLADGEYVEQLARDGGALSEPTSADPELRATVESLRGEDVAAWVAKHRGDDALYERFNHYAPMGECSQDDHPEQAARVHAELALARRDQATFMQLEFRLLSDRFPRAAWSNFAEEKRPTFSPSLKRAGVDLERLLTGLVLSSPGRKQTPNAGRVARAIRELGMVEVMLPKLEALATRRDLDTYNRLRAAEVWRLSQLGPEPTAARAEEVKARGRKLALEPLSRALLEATR